MKFILVFFTCLFFLGCAGIPVPKHNLAPLNNVNEITARKEISQYNTSIIQKANIINSTTFTFKGRTMSALGITKIDSENKNFSVAGFNPMGITLFKIKMENDKVVSSYVIPQFGGNNLDKVADMISKDIARIYFNRKIDPKNKSLTLENDKVSLMTQINKNDYQYIFRGSPLKLATKEMYENNKKIWSIDYYDYKKTNPNTSDLQIPFTIFLKNYKYGYVLEIDTKEIKQLLN